jgi:hypothetical protein
VLGEHQVAAGVAVSRVVVRAVVLMMAVVNVVFEIVAVVVISPMVRDGDGLVGVVCVPRGEDAPAGDQRDEHHRPRDQGVVGGAPC